MSEPLEPPLPSLPTVPDDRDAFDERPTTAPQSNWAAASPASLARGRFFIERLHAQGGLGQVSLARDRKLGRQVALKEIRSDRRAADSRRRFLVEAAITGRLEHPGVVPIYTLEEDETGEPYYVMRFIRGRTLDEAIEAYHDPAKWPSDQSEHRLAFHALLQRFVGICQTMAYAHSQRIIHRDLKPDNIMLGDYGETLVVDWGLAKDMATAEAPSGEAGLARTLPPGVAPTQLGQAVGTPAYMAPEQAAGRWNVVGPRSDIYSLGAVLFEVLTGERAVRGQNVIETLEHAQLGQFPTPSKLKADVPKALEAICLKAMAHEPEDRYATAADLATDVEHWLADEPVSAYAEPWSLRLRRWGRRHRAVMSSGVVALLLGVAALIGVTFLVQQHAAVVEQQRNELADRNERARLAIEIVTSDAAIEQLGREKELRDDQKEFLRTMLSYYESYAQAAAATEQERFRQAQACFRMGRMNQILVSLQDSETAYRRAIVLYEQLAADFAPNSMYRQGLALNHNNLGNLLVSLGLRPEAEKEYRLALNLQEKLVADSPSTRQYREDLARTNVNLGLLLANLGQWAAAEPVYRRALEAYEKLAAEFPTVPEYRQDLAKGHHNLGHLLREHGDLRAAESEHRRALDIRRKLTAEFRNVPQYQQDLAGSHNGLGLVLANLGQRPAAEQEYRLALALDEKLATEFASVPEYRSDLASTHLNLGSLLADMGQPPAAEQEYRQALTIQAKLADDFPAIPLYRRELGKSRFNLGVLLARLGQRAAAEQEYRRALDVQNKLATDFPAAPEYRRDLAASHDNLGSLLAESGNRTVAEEEYRQGLTIRAKLAAAAPAVPEHRWELARSHYNLANLLRSTGQRPLAEREYRQALALFEKLAADFPSVSQYRQDLAANHANLALVLSELGQGPAAEQEYRRAVDRLEKLAAELPSVPAYQVELARIGINLGSLLTDQGQAEASLGWFAKAVALLEPLASTAAPTTTERLFLRNAHFGRAQALAKLGRHADAFKDWDQALELNAVPAHEPILRRNRADSHARAGDHAKAFAEANALAEAKDVTGPTLYDLACICALASAAVKDDAKLQDRYAARAVELLRQAFAKGYKDFKHLKMDDDLKTLRERADYVKLLKELEAKP